MKIPELSPRAASIFRTVFALIFCIILGSITTVRLLIWDSAEHAEMERTGYWGVTSATIVGGLLLYPAYSVLAGLVCGAHFKRLFFFPLLLPFLTGLGFGSLITELVYQGLCLAAMLISRKICEYLRWSGRSDTYVDWLFVFVAVFVILCALLCYYANTDHPRRWGLMAFALIPAFWGFLGFLAAGWDAELRRNTLIPPAVVLLLVCLVPFKSWLAMPASALACWLGVKAREACRRTRSSAKGRP